MARYAIVIATTATDAARSTVSDVRDAARAGSSAGATGSRADGACRVGERPQRAGPRRLRRPPPRRRALDAQPAAFGRWSAISRSITSRRVANSATNSAQLSSATGRTLPRNGQLI
jgi:hypothetical protein